MPTRRNLRRRRSRRNRRGGYGLISELKSQAENVANCNNYWANDGYDCKTAEMNGVGGYLNFPGLIKKKMGYRVTKAQYNKSTGTTFEPWNGPKDMTAFDPNYYTRTQNLQPLT